MSCMQLVKSDLVDAPVHARRKCLLLFTSRPGGVRHDPQRVLGKDMEMAHLPLVDDRVNVFQT